MDSFIGRTQAGFGKFTTACSVAAVFVAILGYLQLWSGGAFDLDSKIKSIQPVMSFRNTWQNGALPGQTKENARFTFDMQADLSPLFNWNTKQVFAYVTVDYETVSPTSGSPIENSVVIWDRIIQSKDKARIKQRKVPSKYSAWDVFKEFGPEDREVRLTLRWNVQPHVGFLASGATAVNGGGKVQLPALSQGGSS